jgi:hypothetical protein
MFTRTATKGECLKKFVVDETKTSRINKYESILTLIAYKRTYFSFTPVNIAFLH